MKKFSFLLIFIFVLLNLTTMGRAQQWVVRASSRLEEAGRAYIAVSPKIGRALQVGTPAALRAAQVGTQDYMLRLKVGEAVKAYVPARVSVNLRKHGLMEVKSFPGLIADFTKEWPLFLRNSGFADGSPEVLMEARFSQGILEDTVTFEGRFIETFSQVHEWLQAGQLTSPTDVHTAFITVRQQAFENKHGFFTIAVGNKEGKLLDMFVLDFKTAKFISLIDSKNRFVASSAPNNSPTLIPVQLNLVTFSQPSPSEKPVLQP